MNDRELFAFLKRLDAADFEVTEWEADFIESQLEREKYFTEIGPTFSDAQRRKIEQMRKAYEHRLR